MTRPEHDGRFCGCTRREFVWQSGAGFGSAALVDLLSGSGFFSQASAAEHGTTANPLAPKKPHYAAKAKSVIFLFMYGGPSHVDTFDWKPELAKNDGKTIAVKTFGRSGKRNEGRIVGPRFKFKQYGKSGGWVSELFPNLAKQIDDVAILQSMTADSPIHGSAMLQMNTGKILSGSPCLGSWVNYGLGSENSNLPGFVVMLDPTGGPISGAKNWSSGYMPASFQGTTMRPVGQPFLDLAPPEGMTTERQRKLLDTIADLNREHLASRSDDHNLAARISSYELAFAMQKHAPEAVDWAKESAETKALYGIDKDKTRDFGVKCLLARRMVERGVRFIQIYSGGAHNDDNWDAHENLEKNHTFHAGRTDKPIAGLLADLKRKGLLDSTLVIWGGEFGRTIYSQGQLSKTNYGRDHHPRCFTMWMAGGGAKGGTIYGETDDFSYNVVKDPVHIRDFHATVLHLLGFDHERFTVRHLGLDQKLTGVEKARVIRELIA